MSEEATRRALVEATAKALGLPLEAEWLPAVVGNLDAALRSGLFVAEFELSDETEPAPTFEA
jgi:Protein of unknown function (DUF4089)